MSWTWPDQLKLKEKLVKALSKMIPNFVTDLTSDAADTFLVSDPSKPKALSSTQCVEPDSLGSPVCVKTRTFRANHVLRVFYMFRGSPLEWNSSH